MNDRVLILKPEVVKAAKSVAYQWPGILDAEEAEQSLFLHLLESPGTIEKIIEMDKKARYRAVVGIGHQLAKKERTDYNYFKGSFKYCVDEVKGMLKSGALSGSSGRFNGDQMDLVEALEVLRERSPQYVNAIRERYVAGVVPKEKSDEDALRRGLTALTAEMNQAHHRNHMQRDDGPGTRKAVSRSKAHWISKGNYDDDSPEAVQRLQVQARVSGL
jgi:hypothetical protein